MRRRYRSPFNPMNFLEPWETEQASEGLKVRCLPLYDALEGAARDLMDIGDEHGCDMIELIPDSGDMRITIERIEK